MALALLKVKVKVCDVYVAMCRTITTHPKCQALKQFTHTLIKLSSRVGVVPEEIFDRQLFKLQICSYDEKNKKVATNAWQCIYEF